MSKPTLQKKSQKKEFKEKEMLKENVEYAITVSPSEQCWNPREMPTRDRDMQALCVDKIIKIMRATSTVMLVPEMSHMGRWHWHGVIKIFEPYDFYMKVIPALTRFTSLEIKEIDDAEGWTTYMFKNQAVMEPGLTKKGYPYRLFNDTEMCALSDNIKNLLNVGDDLDEGTFGSKRGRSRFRLT